MHKDLASQVLVPELNTAVVTVDNEMLLRAAILYDADIVVFAFYTK